MNAKHFLHACEFIRKNLVNLDMNRAFNSIGSNVFFEFGKEKEVVSKNGRKSIQKEWSIWLSNASWRVSKKGKYVVGSGDAPEAIQSSIQKLLGKRFQSFQFLSQFLDVEFNFEDEYQLTTFFNWHEEDQWTLFLPNQTNIGVDCSSPQAIKNVQNIAKYFPVIENYQTLDFPQEEIALINITYNMHGQPSFHFENESSINLENCIWRLEKDENYLVGYLDSDPKKINAKMSELIEKKLKEINIVNSMMDAIFQFEDQYILKVFTCFKAVNQWRIYYRNASIFEADIQIEILQ